MFDMNFNLIFLFLFVAGCSSSSQNISASLEQKDYNNTPPWIVNPNKKNQICSIGSVPIQVDEKINISIAILRAKANISKEISIYVDSQSESIKNSHGKSEFSNLTSLQSTNLLKNIKIIDTYIDTINNMYYLRACSKL